jgi:glucose/arabinose dehydrogenase
MDWAPGTDRLYLIDHGPSGLEIEDGRVGNDELNRVAPGDNLGWPYAAGLSEGGGLTSPVAEWTRAIAPAGMAFYRGDDEAWRGDLFLTSLATGALVRVQLDDGGEASCQEFIPLGLGRLRLVMPGPDGFLWVGTSNRDGRGAARNDDDVIVRVRPVDRAVD